MSQRRPAAAAILFAAVLAGPALGFDNVEFLNTYQVKGSDKPTAAAGFEGRAYIADREANTLSIVSLSDGKVVTTVGGKAKSKEGFAGPSGVAVGPDGTVYVSDTGNDRVVMLDKDGKWLGTFGGHGSAPGLLRAPRGIAVGPDGRVYVADAGNGRIETYGKDGIFILDLTGGEVGMSNPVRVGVDLSENIYVLDQGGKRMRKFDPEGKTLATLPAKGSGFIVDSFGFLYVVDPDAGKVTEFDPSNQVQGAFGTSGNGTGQFDSPTDLASDGSGGLLISDPGNARVLRYKVENAAKTVELPVNRRTKIFLTGPVWTAKQKIGPFVPLEDGLFGYKLDTKELVRLDDHGDVALKFGPFGKDPGQVREPKSIAWSKDLGVFVSDTGNSRIQFFTDKGKFTGVFGEKAGWFSSSSKEGKVRNPEGIAVNDKGTLYVADVGNHRVQAVSSQGVFLFTIGPKVKEGLTLSEPCAVQWDPKGRLYILDRGLKKVIEVEPNGKFVKAWGQVGARNQDWQEPVAMAYDGHDYLYVLDRKAARLRVYDSDGNWVTNAFSRGEGEKALTEPAEIRFRGYRLFISDPGSSRVMAYDVRPVLAPPSTITAAAGEGKADLSWAGQAEPWVEKYHLQRAAQPNGPFEEIKTVNEAKYTDSPDNLYTTYYYRVVVEAKTGDLGAPSNAAVVYVPGSFNAPPVAISKIDLDYVFSANYKYYLNNPVGTLTIVNNVDQNFSNVKLSFFLKDFMDFPSTIDVPEVKARAKTEVPLKATLNNKILDVSEDTPILAEFKITYYEKGKEQSFDRTKAVKVLSRNAITWDRSERLANFVTPNDDPIVDFRAASLSLDPKLKNAPHNSKLNDAMVLWSAVSAGGLTYQPDSLNPYAKVKGAEDHPVDRVQMPRDTLRRKGGECKDLVALLGSLYEAAGIETGLLDYPAHIAIAINLRGADPADIGLPEDKLIRFQDSYWLPIETTMVGKSFTQSIEQGITTWRKMDKSGEARLIPLADARKEFEPVSLQKDAWRAPEPDGAKVRALFTSDAEKLDDARYQFLKAFYEDQLSKEPKDVGAMVGIGILEAQRGNGSDAKSQFSKALAADPTNAAALNNLGNLAYLDKDYKNAKESYEKASQADSQDPGILLNLARAELKLGEAKAAKKHLDSAVKLDDSLGPLAKGILELK